MDTVQSSKFPIKNGRDIARYLIYFSKTKDSSKEINIVNISGVTLYRRHRDMFDRLFRIQEKYDFDLVRYCKFFVSRFNFTDENIKKISDPQYILWYAEMLKTNAKYQRIYSYVEKSVDNIVEDCVKLHYSSVKEYLRHLIVENLLGQKFLSGQISRYYLAGIKNLKQIVRKMDNLNRDTLREVVESQESLLSELQDAFLYIRRNRVSIISYTDEKLYRKLSS